MMIRINEAYLAKRVSRWMNSDIKDGSLTIIGNIAIEGGVIRDLEELRHWYRHVTIQEIVGDMSVGIL